MSEEKKQQIEIDIRGWWAVIEDGVYIATFKTEFGAKEYLKMLCDCNADFNNFKIRQITEKIPFVERGLYWVSSKGEIDKLPSDVGWSVKG